MVDINLSIEKGEKILIVGASGSGKSTLGQCLNGLIPHAYTGEQKGSLCINGRNLEQENIYTLSKTIGTVLQDTDAQFVGLTVGEDIAFAMENDQIPTPTMRERVRQVAQMVEIDKLLGLSPFELSGGQKQRTSLAGVMIDEVDILLFDEPLANLDPKTGKRAIEIIDKIHQDTGKTIIIIEHRLEDVLHCSIDRIVLIDEGRIVDVLTPDQMIASDHLMVHGIREPLYVAALKYAGVKLTEELRAAYIDSLRMELVKEQTVAWHRAQTRQPSAKQLQKILEIEEVSFSYDGIRPILKKIHFEVYDGEMVAIAGRNGAGKSTIAKLICGFEQPDQGRIYFQGQDIRNQSIKQRAEKIGYVMQNPNQMISKNLIYDEVALGLRLREVADEEIKSKVEKVLTICGLDEFVDWPISALSYGQKKRVTIASILVLEPKIIILDEPTAGQDYRHYTEIMNFLESINQQGVTVIMITHDMHLMLEYTDRAIVFADGVKIGDDQSSRILTDADIIERGNLKETSLYTLANAVGIEDKAGFVQNFIDYERKEARG